MDAKPTTGLDWLLDDLLKRLPGAHHAVVLSSDGLLLGRSAAILREDAEHLSAVASGFQSLAKGAGRQFGGGAIRQTVVEMEHYYLVVTAAGSGACLALLADVDSDMGMVAYEMNLLVKQVGTYLSAEPRGSQAETDPGRGV